MKEKEVHTYHSPTAAASAIKQEKSMEKGNDTGVVRFSVVRTVGMGIAF